MIYEGGRSSETAKQALSETDRQAVAQSLKLEDNDEEQWQ